MYRVYKAISPIFLSFSLLNANVAGDFGFDFTAVSSNQIPPAKSADKSASEALKSLALAQIYLAVDNENELYHEFDATFKKYNKEVPTYLRSSIENYEKAKNRKHSAFAICEKYENQYSSYLVKGKMILDDLVFFIRNLDYNSANSEIISLIELVSIQDPLKRIEEIRKAIINFDLHSLDNNSEFDDFIQLIQEYRDIDERIISSKIALDAATFNFSMVSSEYYDSHYNLYYNNFYSNNLFSSCYDAFFYDQCKANIEEDRNRANLVIYRNLYKNFFNAQNKLKNHRKNYRDIINLKTCSKQIKKLIERQQFFIVRKFPNSQNPDFNSNTGIRSYLGPIKSLIQPDSIRKFVNFQAARP